MFENGIKYIIFVFKYLVFNGFVERYVCIFKEIMKKMVNEKGSFDIKLSRFLFSYCIIFQVIIGKIFGELFMNCKLKIRLDLVNFLSQNIICICVEDK